MTPTTSSLTPALPELSPEVLAFAAERGAADYLPAVLEMTRRIFPNVPLSVRVAEDAEIAGEQYILFEVVVPDWTAQELLASHHQWTSQIFECCPATHVCVFCLGMVESA
jgi:hypothetical protein